MAETVGGGIELGYIAAEATPGWYYEGEDASHNGAGERPIVGGIASGTGEDGKDIPVIDSNGEGGVTYRKLVNNDAVKLKPIPEEKLWPLGPISDHYLHQR